MNNLLEFLPGSNCLKLNNYTYYTAQDFIELDLPPRGHTLSPWLPEQGIAMVYAPRGVGKTFFALHVAFAVATGGNYLGWQADKRRNVLYIDGEMAASDMKARIQAIYDANPVEGYPNFYIMTPDVQEGIPMPDLATTAGQIAIQPMCASADLIIVDNIATLCRSGNENETHGWKPLQSWALGMRASGKTVLFIHHAGKGGSQRGASSREDVMDTVIELRHPKDYSPDQGAQFEIHFTKHRGFFGEEAQPLEATLSTTDSGQQQWEVKKVSDSTFGRIVELMRTGITQSAVANELGVNKSTVSRYVSKAKAEGLIPIDDLPNEGRLPPAPLPEGSPPNEDSLEVKDSTPDTKPATSCNDIFESPPLSDGASNTEKSGWQVGPSIQNTTCNQPVVATQK